MIVDKTRVFGCDTSHWTGIVNWNVARQQGMTFMIAKALDGISVTRYFVENYEGAKKAGIFTGMYTWMYDGSVYKTADQAKAYADMWRKYPTDLPPTVDFEWSRPVNPDKNDLWDFVKRFEDATGVKPMIYTAPSYWITYGSADVVWNQYDLWMANYGVSVPMAVKPWNGAYKLWQFTDRADGKQFGYPAGGEAMADMNYFNGDKEAFMRWIKKSPAVVEPTLEEKVAKLWAAHPEVR